MRRPSTTRPLLPLLPLLPLALALSACGGSSSDSPAAAPPPPAPPAFNGVNLSGTAATGLSLAGAKLEAKCATGNGSATTGNDGVYTLKLDGAALPCLLRVSSANGATVLHSVAEGSGGSATALTTANVTSLTELVLARALGAGSTPALNFAAAAPLSTAKLVEAKATVAAALKAAGIDFGGVDPISAAFKAAVAGGAAGDANDKKLDDLMAALAKGKTSLAELANALASAADAGAATTQVGAALSVPPVAGCPQLRSGAYAWINQRGNAGETQFDLVTMKAGDMTLLPTAEACRFTLKDVQGVANGEVVFGRDGFGVASEASADGGRDTTVVFPKQSVALNGLAGKWNVVEWDRKGPAGTLPRFGIATAELAADGAGVFQACSQSAGAADCSDPTRKNSGQVSINAQGQVLSPGGSKGYAFRSSEGTQVIVWGKPNGDGITILTRATPSVLSTAGSVFKGWEAWGESTAGRPDVFRGNTLFGFEFKLSKVDAVAGSFSDDVGGLVFINKPLNGYWYRPAGQGEGKTWSDSYGLELKGLGVVMGGNHGAGASASAQFNVMVFRP